MLNFFRRKDKAETEPGALKRLDDAQWPGPLAKAPPFVTITEVTDTINDTRKEELKKSIEYACKLELKNTLPGLTQHALETLISAAFSSKVRFITKSERGTYLGFGSVLKNLSLTRIDLYIDHLSREEVIEQACKCIKEYILEPKKGCPKDAD